MTTTTASVPSGEELDAACVFLGDEDLVHMVRLCDPDTALCGEQVPGDEFTDEDDDAGPHCPECTAIDRAGDTAHVAICAVCRED